MKKFAKGLAVLVVCGMLNFFSGFAKTEAAENFNETIIATVSETVNLNNSDDEILLASPPPPIKFILPRYGSPPPHRHGAPPPPRYGPPPPPHRHDAPPPHHSRDRW